MLVRVISKLNHILVTRKSRQCLLLRTISNAPIVTVEHGKLKGSMQKLLDGSLYYSFKGIPYGQPPVGKLRFKAPLPALPWNNVYDATEHGPVCPHMDMITTQVIPGDENCLFLNVYSKNLSDGKRPVIVFIHGGGFISGSGNDDMYGPRYLVQHDIVLVTINYRLEVLGFLCLDTEEVPGNAGMKDQVLALKWVKKNIVHFGGDPDNVTLMGESAGAASVTYHMVSPMSKHLFHKSIVQSGVCISDWAIGLNSKERAFRAARVLGHKTDDTKDLLQFLQSVPAFDLVKLTFKTVDSDEKLRGLPLHFCPVVEKKFPNVESFLNEHSINLLLANKFHDVPMIIGYNSCEGAMMMKDFVKKIELLNKELHYKLNREIAQKASPEKLNEFGEMLRSFYFKGKNLSKDCRTGMSSLDSDMHFIYNIHRFINIYLMAAKSPVYLYRFAYDTVLNIMKTAAMVTDFEGATHADDLFYLFSSDMTKELVEEDDKARSLIFEITKLWTNFAKTGNPTPDVSLGLEWKPFNTKSKYFLNMRNTLTLEQNANQANVEFWNKMYSGVGLPCITKSNL